MAPLLLLLVPLCLAAQAPANFSARIEGLVEVDGLAVPGVTVTVTDPATGQRYLTSTAEDGRFTVRVAHPGRFDVATSMLAFSPAHAQVTVAASGAPSAAPLHFNLTLASAAPPAQAAAHHPASAPSASLARRRPLQQPANRRSFRQLDVSQTGNLVGNADAGAAESGIAGMTTTTATDSDVVVGAASQDESPMNGAQILRLLRANGTVPG
ncbi:MAG: carboxypeptidase-like regulatory domain-containing protein, partial [Terriglobales bacterium]